MMPKRLGQLQTDNKHNKHKIKSVDAPISTPKRFNNYLSNRYQVLQLYSSVSDSPPLECCVPHGRSTECYIDDTKLFVSFSLHYSHRIVQEVNEDLLQVRNWCFRNRLLLNQDKTKLIVFGSQQMTSKLHEFHLSLVGKNISPVQSGRD